AVALARLTAGRSSPARIAMIAMTTNSSIKVKAGRNEVEDAFAASRCCNFPSGRLKGNKTGGSEDCAHFRVAVRSGRHLDPGLVEDDSITDEFDRIVCPSPAPLGDWPGWARDPNWAATRNRFAPDSPYRSRRGSLGCPRAQAG